MTKPKGGFDMGFRMEHFQLIEVHASTVTIVCLSDDATYSTNESQHGDLTKDLEIYLGLQATKPNVCRYSDIQTCLEALRDVSKHPKVILLVSQNRPLGEADMKQFCDMSHVEYIFEFNSDIPCRKIRGKVFNDVNQLSQVESDLHFIPSDIATIPIEQFNDEISLLFSFQILLELLQNVACQPDERDRMINFLKSECSNDEIRLGAIQKYQDNRPEEKAISCYTGGSCIPILLNKTLREKKPTCMSKIHYFIYQLYTELKQLHDSQKQKELKSLEKVYRGKIIDAQELSRFQGAIGKFVMTNSYVSSSTNKKVASVFAPEKELEAEARRKVSAVFSMKMTASHQSEKPMAFVDRNFQTDDHEKELLLSAGIVFSVHSVKKIERNTWKIKLIRKNREEKIEQELYHRLKEYTKATGSSLETLSRLRKADKPEINDEYRYVITELNERETPVREDHSPFSISPESLDPTGAVSSRFMQPWRTLTSCLSPYPRMIIFAFIFLLTLALVLIVVLPIVLIKQHISTSTPETFSTTKHPFA